MANRKPIVAIIGATGLQGGSVARYLFDDGTFAIRAITRNPNSEKAKALAAQGAEAVQANVDDIDSLRRAFKGAYAVFAVTNFWEILPPPPGAPEHETQQGKNMVDAAAGEGILHFLWSSVPSQWWDQTEDKAEHIESKAKVDRYLQETNKVPFTVVATGSYYENIFNFRTPKKNAKGELILEWQLPDNMVLSSYSVNELGGWVLPILKNPKEYLGKTVDIYVQNISTPDWAKLLQEFTGKPVHVPPMTREELIASRHSGQWPFDELWKAMVILTGVQAPPEALAYARSIYPEASDLHGFLEKNWKKIVDKAVPA